MAKFRTFLFGKFRVERNGTNIEAITPGKVQELFCYLLVFRGHPQPREVLSETIWENQSIEKSRKYLRHTLWKLLCALHQGQRVHEEPLLRIEPGWVELRPGGNLWLDLAEFEQVYKRFEAKKAHELSLVDYDAIRNVVVLYTGDVLEGCYQDWCLFERERFRRMHLMLLDKLAKYCEEHQDYRTGLTYGAEILRQDGSYERAHRLMMRLYFLSGDRTQALRQYEVCKAALAEELGVAPSKTTIELYERIRADNHGLSHKRRSGATEQDTRSLMICDTLRRLESLSGELDAIRLQVQGKISLLKDICHLT